MRSGYKERTGCGFFWGEREIMKVRDSHGDQHELHIALDHECSRPEDHGGVHICGVCLKQYI